MSRKSRTKRTTVLALPPAILEQAVSLAEIKEMSFDKFVSELVWVAVATDRQKAREMAEALGFIAPGQVI